MNADERGVVRVLDANVNRLREALRVLEECARMVRNEASRARELKRMRHDLELFERDVGRGRLLEARDTVSDPFSSGTTPEELARAGFDGLVAANLKRGQEAARVLEEFVKLTPAAHSAEIAKRIRFALYQLEKELMEPGTDGSTQGN